MAGNMALGEAGEMGDCQGCGGDDPASACDTPCLAPMMATLSPDTAFPALPSEPARAAVGDRLASPTGPPDTSPPRPIILHIRRRDSSDRKRIVWGKSGSVRVDPGGSRDNKKN